MQLYEKFQKVIFFDTETTGFDPKENQIIELAAIVCERGKAPVEHDDYIQLEHVADIPKKITELTGITPLHCSTGISELTMCQNMSEWLKTAGKARALLIAHNAQFDLNFLGRTYERFMKPDARNPDKKSLELISPFGKADFLDTLTVYRDRSAFPHKLQSAINHYDLGDKVTNNHRAIDDTRALKAVCEAMADERDDLMQYVNVFGYNPKYGVEGGLLKRVEYYAQENNYSGFRAPERTLPYVWSHKDPEEAKHDPDDWRVRTGRRK